MAAPKGKPPKLVRPVVRCGAPMTRGKLTCKASATERVNGRLYCGVHARLARIQAIRGLFAKE